MHVFARRLRGAAFGASLAAASPLVAQSTKQAPDSAAADSVARRERAQALEGVRVTAKKNRSYATERTSTATKTPTALRDVPQAVTVVSRALIADQAMQGMGDVVRYVPGVTMS